MNKSIIKQLDDTNKLMREYIEKERIALKERDYLKINLKLSSRLEEKKRYEEYSKGVRGDVEETDWS